MGPARIPIFELPREIRDIIYWHRVVLDEPLELHEPLHENKTRMFRVCKRLYEEASEVFYKENVFLMPVQFFFNDEPVDRMLAGPLYRLPPKKLAMVTKLDIEVPVCKSPNGYKSELAWTDGNMRGPQVSSLPNPIVDPRPLRRLKVLVEILAATATPKLQLRFLCQDLLYHDSPTVTNLFAKQTVIRLDLRYRSQSVLDRKVTNNPAALQLLRWVLWKIRTLLGKVQMHIIVLVHPAFLRKARATLVSDSFVQSTFEHPIMLVAIVPASTAAETEDPWLYPVVPSLTPKTPIRCYTDMQTIC